MCTGLDGIVRDGGGCNPEFPGLPNLGRNVPGPHVEPGRGMRSLDGARTGAERRFPRGRDYLTLRSEACSSAVRSAPGDRPQAAPSGIGLTALDGDARRSPSARRRSGAPPPPRALSCQPLGESLLDLRFDHVGPRVGGLEGVWVVVVFAPGDLSERALDALAASALQKRSGPRRCPSRQYGRTAASAFIPAPPGGGARSADAAAARAPGIDKRACPDRLPRTPPPDRRSRARVPAPRRQVGWPRPSIPPPAAEAPAAGRGSRAGRAPPPRRSWTGVWRSCSGRWKP